MNVDETTETPGPPAMMFPDHFSGHADRYEEFRPTYPDELFAYLASLAQTHDLACDCATGNGQAAVGLTPHFRSIVALDASGQQLGQAAGHDRIVYVQVLADRTPLPDGSVDLVTAASAFHWFDLPKFYREVRRIARPAGILALWGYRMPSVTPAVDAVVQRLSAEVLRRFWLPETKLAAEGYRTIGLPFEEIKTPRFRMTHDWNLDQLAGFTGTWSASLRYRDHTGLDPVDAVREELAAAWGNADDTRQVSWNLHLRGQESTGPIACRDELASNGHPHRQSGMSVMSRPGIVKSVRCVPSRLTISIRA